MRKLHQFVVRKSFALPNGQKTTKGDIFQAYCRPFVAGNSEPVEYFRLEMFDESVIRIPAAHVRFYEVEIKHGN